jgi:hypothetical protein
MSLAPGKLDDSDSVLRDLRKITSCESWSRQVVTERGCVEATRLLVWLGVDRRHPKMGPKRSRRTSAATVAADCGSRRHFSACGFARSWGPMPIQLTPEKGVPIRQSRQRVLSLLAPTAPACSCPRPFWRPLLAARPASPPGRSRRDRPPVQRWERLVTKKQTKCKEPSMTQRQVGHGGYPFKWSVNDIALAVGYC